MILLLHICSCVHLVGGAVLIDVVPMYFHDVLRAIMNDAGLDHMQVRVEQKQSYSLQRYGAN